MGLRLSMQRLSIYTSVFVLDYARYEVYSIQLFVIQFISGLLQAKLSPWFSEDTQMKVTPMMLHFPAPIKVTATILRHPSPIHDTPFPRNNLSEDHGTSYPAPMQAIATILRVSL